MPARAKFAQQFAHLRESYLERFETLQLAADVHRQPAHFETFELRQAAVDSADPIIGHTELVLGLAGRNFLMRPRIDIRIDPQRAGGAEAARSSDRSKLDPFFLAFDVELADPGLESLDHLARHLADAREDDVLTRHPGDQCTRQLAA